MDESSRQLIEQMLAEEHRYFEVDTSSELSTPNATTNKKFRTDTEDRFSDSGEFAASSVQSDKKSQRKNFLLAHVSS